MRSIFAAIKKQIYDRIKMNANKNVQHWNDLGVKDKAALVTACISFGLGFVLIFVGMFIGEVGEINGSVLTAFGTCLIYTAGIFGVTMYFKTNNAELMNRMLDEMERRFQKRMNERQEDSYDAD